MWCGPAGTAVAVTTDYHSSLGSRRPMATLCGLPDAIADSGNARARQAGKVIILVARGLMVQLPPRLKLHSVQVVELELQPGRVTRRPTR